MYIKKIRLNSFRNYENETINFHDKINIIYGDNAEGKTNIIEAIYYCAFGKTFKNNKDHEIVKFEYNYFNIGLEFLKKSRDNEINVFYDKEKNNKKVLINGVLQKKLSNLYGKLNLVIFKPEDINIIKGGPDKRRKFLDNLIGSLKPKYIDSLSRYHKILNQRNSILKQISSELDKGKDFNDIDMSLIEVLNEQLTDEAKIIFKYREEYIDKINKLINLIHQKYIISKMQEEIEIKYTSILKNEHKFVKQLNNNLKRDIFIGHTSVGVHRDDFEILLNDRNIQKYGSQGQQKSTILSLKLAELEVLKNETKESPILILDDFMSELDSKRIDRFLKNMEKTQIFITATTKISLKKYLKEEIKEKDLKTKKTKSKDNKKSKEKEINIVKYIKVKDGKTTEE